MGWREKKGKHTIRKKREGISEKNTIFYVDDGK